MGKRTFLFGAGFSKAVAKAQTMKEIWGSFEKIYEKEKRASSNNRVSWFNKLDNFIKNIEELAYKQLTKDINKIEEGIRENLEYLFTLIDMHTLYNADFNFGSKKSIDSYPVIPFEFTNKDELAEIRTILLTYLYITFEQVEGNQLLNEFASIINKTDEIITFNYDLLIEKALWRKGIWSPHKGYVGVTDFVEKNDYKDFEESKKISNIKLHKMHGSISWDVPKKMFNNKEIKIKLENDKGQFYYEDLNKIISREPKLYKKNKSYQGKHLPPWILPSFVKPFDKRQIYKIWKSAIKKISNTKELVIIGYSFRPEDTNSQLLLANLPSESKIILVNPDPDVKDRLENDLGYKVDKHYNFVEDYLKNFKNSIRRIDK
ncbi:MAG: SIR2 family protein [bacterium]